MLELIVNRTKDIKTIALLENGKLVEKYDETASDDRNEGNIYAGRVKDILSGMQAAFVDIGTDKNSFIHLKDILPKVDETKEENESFEDIKKIISQNDKLLVQVKKDSNDKKGARVSTHITLPSRYVALMPNTDIITISQKIENKEEKQRLLKIVKENLSQENGAIIRTSAQDKSEQEIVNDLKNIESKWKSIYKNYKKTNSSKPQLIYKSEDIMQKIIIDMIDKGLEKITVNCKDDEETVKMMQEENEDFKKIKLELVENKNLIEEYDLVNQIKKTENRKVWLKCGGFITIDKTEALTAIDVNTGKYTGTKDVEETIYKVNEDATVEIAKQLRLRDIGGIIIIDYIDMKSDKNKEKIYNLLKENLKKDRAKTQIEGFTKLNLMELTRKHICSHQN